MNKNLLSDNPKDSQRANHNYLQKADTEIGKETLKLSTFQAYLSEFADKVNEVGGRIEFISVNTYSAGAVVPDYVELKGFFTSSKPDSEAVFSPGDSKFTYSACYEVSHNLVKHWCAHFFLTKEKDYVLIKDDGTAEGATQALKMALTAYFK